MAKRKSTNKDTGRPRKYDLEEEAKALEEWVKDPNVLVLRLFAAIRGYADQEKLYEYCHMSDSFRRAYNNARIIIGSRREQLLMKGIGNATPFNRYASLYDKDLKEHEINMKRSESSLTTGDIKIEKIDYSNAE